MERQQPDLTTLVIIGAVFFVLGAVLRNRYNHYLDKRLIKELENFFGEKLPVYKKDPGKINWPKVLKMLKNKPTTQQIAHWKEQVKKKV